jgi:hypothetical protein
MARKLEKGDIVKVPGNFGIKKYRGWYVRVKEVHGDLLTLDFYGETFDATTEDISARRALNVQQRWEILDRDRFRCRVCGRGAGARPGLTLQVDHKIPFSKGGKSEDLENLWTLCSDCNSGKGTRSIEDAPERPKHWLSMSDLKEAGELIQQLDMIANEGKEFSRVDSLRLLSFAIHLWAEVWEREDL